MDNLESGIRPISIELVSEPSSTTTDSTDFTLDIDQLSTFTRSQQSASCSKTCQLSYNAIKTTFSASKYVLNEVWNHKEYKQYQPNIRKLFCLELFLCLLTVAVDVGISFPMQWAFTALDESRSNHSIAAETNSTASKSPVSFTTAVIIYSIISIVSSPLHGIENYVENLLYIRFREATTKCLLNDFHSNFAFYYLATSGTLLGKDGASSSTMENPGQRYEMDIDWWTYSITMLLFHMIRQLVTIIAIIIVMVHLGVNIVLYAFIGAVAITLGCLAFYGAAITQLQTIINEEMAAYRAGMVRTSDNAEAISLYKAHRFEEKWSFQRLLAITSHKMVYYKYMGILESVLNATSTVGLMLPVFLLASDFFKGKLALGVVTQSAYGFQMLLLSLTTVIGQMDKIGCIQATATRLSELMQALEKIVNTMNNPPVIEKECVSARSNMYTATPTNHQSEYVVRPGMIIDVRENARLTGVKFKQIPDDASNKDIYLKVHDLSVVVPQSETLLMSDLAFTVAKNESLLIVGPSGAGKSSLMRVFAKLWKFGHGTISTLSSNCMFLPQRPYLPILPPSQNTLENQLLFPKFHRNRANAKDNGRDSITDSELKTLLTSLNLAYILEYDKQPSSDENDPNKQSKDWSKLLSLGEQQRLAIGRVLLQKPKLIFLDESTSALDSQNQEQMYQLLRQNNITFVSVGHRPNLHKYHQNVLIVLGDGNWKYMSSQEYDENYIQKNAGFQYESD